MLNKILEFSKGNFYQEKAARIAEVVNDYARLKENRAGEEDLAVSGALAAETLAAMMKESGFSGEENPFISLDKEFFTPEGLLEPDKLAGFQKEIIKHYSMQQIRWSFSGTTGQFTSITIKNLKKQHISYPDLLPLELKKEYVQKKRQQHKQPAPGKYQAFIYQDGSVSQEILPEKSMIRLDILHDDSGFDFSSGYSPDNTVNKKDWIAGFNKQDEWEKISLNPAGGFSAGINTDPVSIFTGQEKNGSIGLFSYADLVYLFDNLSILMDGEEDSYYSLSGELYGSRQINKEETLKNLQQVLRQNKIKKLKGIVLRNATPEAVAFYKKILADYITAETEFFNSYDEALGEKLDSTRQRIREEDISGMVISGFIQPSENVLTGEDLYQKLTPSTVESTYPVPLDIFASENDLFTFLSLPEIHDTIEEETVRYIKTVKVPPAKRTAYSNAVQNLLHNYKQLFRRLNIPQQKLLEMARELIIEEKQTVPLGKEKVTGEMNLYDLIKAGTKSSPNTEIPSFKPVFKKDKDYYDVFNEQEFKQWWEAELKARLPRVALETIKKTIKGLELKDNEKSEFNRALQKTLLQYPAIAASTGMTPAEIIRYVMDVVVNKQDTGRLGSKRIFFENDLEELIKEAALDNPHRVEIRKEDLYSQDNDQLIWKPFSEPPNLFLEDDRQAFLKSPIIQDSLFSDNDKTNIEEFLQTTPVPREEQLDFSGEIMNALRSYQYKLKHTGLKPVQALRHLAAVRKQQDPDLKPGIVALLKQAAGSKQKVSEAGLNAKTGPDRVSLDINQPATRTADLLDNLLRNKLDDFMTHPVVISSGLSRKEAMNLASQVKKSRLPAAAKAAYKKAVYQILQNYQQELSAKGITAAAAAKAASASLSGKKKSIPGNLRSFIEKITAPVEQLSPAKKESLFRGKKQRETGFPDSRVDITPALNLFDEEDFMTFANTPVFQKSGLSPEELKQVLAEHKTSYRNRQQRFYSNVPLKFREIPQNVSPREQQLAVPIRTFPGTAQAAVNSVSNLGWMQRQNQAGLFDLEFTAKGRKYFDPRNRQLIAALASSGKTQTASPVTVSTNSVITGTDQQQIINQPDNSKGGLDAFTHTVLPNGKVPDLIQENKQRVTIATPFNFIPGSQNSGQQELEMSFKHPADYMKNSGIQAEFSNPLQKRLQDKQRQASLNKKQKQIIKQPDNFLPADKKQTGTEAVSSSAARLKRIEENYYQDKRMLAASKNQGLTASEQKAAGSKTNRNVINESAEDLLNSFIDKAREESL